MADYAQIVKAPEFRNLAVNPSAEETYAATWTASNGDVTVGADNAPGGRTGTGFARYQVTARTSNGYRFGPMGPSGDVHLRKFRLPPSGAVAAKVYVRTNGDPIWVQLQARWYIKSWPNGTKGAPDLSRTGQVTNITGILRLDGGIASPWEKLAGRLAPNQVPNNATHFDVVVSVYGSGGANPDVPPMGTVVWADDAFVPDNGVDVTDAPLVMGGINSSRWEGEPNHSTSVNTPAPVAVEPDAPPPPPSDPSVVDPANPEAPPVEEDPLGEGNPSDVSPDAPIEPDTVPEPFDPLQDNPVDPGPVVPKAAVSTEAWTTNRDGGATVEDLPPDPGYSARPPTVVASENMVYREGGRTFCLKRDVQLSNLIMNSVDSNGVAWIVTDIDGWWTAPDPDVPDLPKSWFDGSYETRGRYTARTLTLSGSFIPQHASQVPAARDRLIRAANLVHRGGWFMTHEDPDRYTNTKGAKVWQVAQPLISTETTNGRTNFSIALRAPDPLKYGIKEGRPPGFENLVLRTTQVDLPGRKYDRKYPWAYPEAVFGNSSVLAVNRGNAVVLPVLRMKGPTNGAVRVHNATTGQTLRITRQLYPGEELLVDCATKQVTMNGSGNFRFYLDIDVDWLMLQPGENRLHLTEETYGGVRTELEVLWRSGWIG